MYNPPFSSDDAGYFGEIAQYFGGVVAFDGSSFTGSDGVERWKDVMKIVEDEDLSSILAAEDISDHQLAFELKEGWKDKLPLLLTLRRNLIAHGGKNQNRQSAGTLAGTCTQISPFILMMIVFVPTSLSGTH